MSLSVDLISQFAKITKDEEKSKTETIVYGTAVEYKGNKYVKLDGSDLLTPVTSTTSVKDGERVTVMIKNHMATITGNLTAPSASSKEVADVAEAASKIKEVEILLADKVSTDKFDAQNARIDTLVNENITITQRLTASEGDIEELQTGSLQVKEDLTAAQASIAELETNKLDAEAADLKYDITAVESSIDLAEERISTAETLIEQLTDSIMTLVTDGNGESLMVQTKKGWTFSTGQIQDTVNTTSENLNKLTNEVGNANSAISILQQAVTDLGILNDYIKIGTYEDEPCIELGETDSNFRLLITNTRILFMEGTGVPAYISNQSLYITKAVIKEELQQGEFTWKARSNGNLGLIWKGVS